MDGTLLGKKYDLMKESGGGGGGGTADDVTYDNTESGLTATNVQAAIDEMVENFGDGVDEVYNACVSAGSTPASKSPADIASAIGSISGGISGIFPIKWAGYEETKTIPANTGKYFLFFIMAGWGNQYHDISDLGTITGVTNATFTQLNAFGAGNENSDQNSQLFRLYLIEKTDETIDSVITTTGEMDAFVLSGIKGVPTFGTFTNIRAVQASNSFQFSSDYEILIILENTDRAGKTKPDIVANDISAVNALCMFTDYSSYQRAWIYFIAKNGDEAVIKLREGEFSATNVHIISHASVTISSNTRKRSKSKKAS